jgi:hypothetical protein
VKVEKGQIWRHVRSGDVRTVLAIVPYRERALVPPSEIETQMGITHIAVMSLRDRRDSSDMVLTRGEPTYASSWELILGA